MVKKNYEDVSQQIIKLVGGKENITYFTHCVTRLRFNVKDVDLIDVTAIEQISEVSGTQWFGDQFQIIVGAKVDDIYAMICKLGDFEKKETINENLDQKKNIGINAVIEYISGAVAPVLPILIGTSFVKIVVLLMELFNWHVDSGTYQVLTFAGDAGFYFLPVFVGGYAAKKLNCSIPLGLLLGAILIHPTLIEAVNNNTPLNIYGLPITLVNYSSGFLPVVIGVYIMSKIEKLIRKITPEFIQAIVVPFITIMLMLPIMLCIIGPLGTVLGKYLGNAIVWLYESFGFIGVALMGAFAPLIVVSGMHMTLVVYAITLFGELGYEPLVFVTGIIATLCQSAACLGVFIKTKNASIKSNALASFLSAGIGGVSEPALFGITIRYKTPLYAAFVGGGVGGAIAGLTHAVAYGLLSSSIWNIVAFLPGGMANFIWMLVACIVGFIVTLVLTLYLYHDQESEE
ncbi:PTS transporter subunit EIIC [Thomasclavelia sp.]|uniref:PTS transporter subunit EIIC n=1 Tax=Thomasclavelia sp. TaxID=3025757 RepID=UPI0025D93EAA|nr:PTS transporter subunit EIIC [Thomasclavelia sp.]